MCLYPTLDTIYGKYYKNIYCRRPVYSINRQFSVNIPQEIPKCSEGHQLVIMIHSNKFSFHYLLLFSKKYQLCMYVYCDLINIAECLHVCIFTESFFTDRRTFMYAVLNLNSIFIWHGYISRDFPTLLFIEYFPYSRW